MRQLYTIGDVRAELNARLDGASLACHHARAGRTDTSPAVARARYDALLEAVDVIESYRTQRRDGPGVDTRCDDLYGA